MRAGGETKTRQSRRTLALPVRCAEALIFHRDYQDRQKAVAASKWHEHGLVFASAVGTQRNANNVLRSFRAIVKRAGLNEAEWTRILPGRPEERSARWDCHPLCHPVGLPA